MDPHIETLNKFMNNKLLNCCFILICGNVLHSTISCMTPIKAKNRFLQCCSIVIAQDMLT